MKKVLTPGIRSGRTKGMNDFDVVQIIRARKQHKCEECREPIHVGEKYMRRSGKFDGGMYATKMCLSCKDAYPTWEVLDAYGLRDDEWPTFGDLDEWLYETLGRPQDLTGTMRERIAAMGKMAREYVAQNFIPDKWGRLVRKPAQTATPTAEFCPREEIGA